MNKNILPCCFPRAYTERTQVVELNVKLDSERMECESRRKEKSFSTSIDILKGDHSRRLTCVHIEIE